MSEVAEDSLLGGSKNEAAVSTAQDGVEGAAGVVCFWRLLLKETVWELTPLVAFGLARQTVEF